MKSISANMTTHLGQETTTLATCWELTRRDGTVFRFTDHDVDIPFGGDTFLAATGFTRTAIANNASLAVDNLELDGIIDSETITIEDIEAGLFDHAEMRIFNVNWKDPDGDGDIKLRRGRIGEVTHLPNGTYHAEHRGMMQAFSRKIVELVATACRVDLGSPECMIPLAPADWVARTQYTDPAVLGDGTFVAPLLYIDRIFKVQTDGKSGDVEPTWNLTVGGTTNDFLSAAAWVASTVYAVGDFVTQITPAGNEFFRCTVAGTSHTSEPAWDIALGATTVETGGVEWETEINTLVWETVEAWTKIMVVTIVTDRKDFVLTNLSNRLSNPRAMELWTALGTATVTQNNVVAPDGTTTADTINTPVVGDGVEDEITVAIAAADVWDGFVLLSGTGDCEIAIADDTDTEETATPVTLTGTMTLVAVTHTFASARTGVKLIIRRGTGDTATAIEAWHGVLGVKSNATADNWFTDGVVKFTSGNNVNLAMEIKAWSSGGGLNTFLAMPFDVNVGDEVVLHPGCNKLILGDCKVKFDNVVNHRAEPYLPGQDELFKFPDSPV